jgi:hypothetical protein
MYILNIKRVLRICALSTGVYLIVGQLVLLTFLHCPDDKTDQDFIRLSLSDLSCTFSQYISTN